MAYTGKRALVLGLGESGLAMARYLAHQGAFVRVADTRQNPQNREIWLDEMEKAKTATEFVAGAFTEELLDGMDLVAISPGLIPHTDLSLILPLAKERNLPVISEIEIFAKALAHLEASIGYRPRIIAITGTNGKTTVTNLTGHMCRKAQRTVKVAGNVSPAVLDVLLTATKTDSLPQIWVLELSSFQLWSTKTLNADVAVILNISQDHLDWHESMEAYIAAKKRIFGPKTIRVLNRNDPFIAHFHPEPDGPGGAGAPQTVTFGLDRPKGVGDFGLVSDRGLDWFCMLTELETGDMPGKKKAATPKEERLQMLMPAAALLVKGRHNAANALAAMALGRAIGLSMAPLLYALREYRGEPHRMEPVMTVNGVLYIDDSKATNVGATVAAIESLGHDARSGEGRLVLIAGGDGKDQEFGPLREVMSGFVKTVFLIGKDAPLLDEVLAKGAVPRVLCESLEEAVDGAAEIARQGDVVLLSPACASMDMFENYRHRSGVFVAAVKEIAAAHGEVVL